MINCSLKQITRVRHSIPVHIKTQTHKYNELVYFISGNGSTNIAGKQYNYHAGDVAFYKAGTPHDELDPEPCDIIWMHFEFQIDDIQLTEGLFADRDGKLLLLMQKLRNLSLDQNKYTNQLVECCLAEIIVTIAKTQSESAVSSDKLNVEKILNYIDTNITEQIDFYRLAKDNNYSYDRFRHLFVERIGESPYAYLTERRIQHAKRLLKNSYSSVTEIAFACGFNSSSQFTNIFKKHVGTTPKEYKKRVSSK